MHTKQKNVANQGSKLLKKYWNVWRYLKFNQEMKKSSIKRVKFAGKSFLINENGEINEEIIEAPK